MAQRSVVFMFILSLLKFSETYWNKTQYKSVLLWKYSCMGVQLHAVASKTESKTQVKNKTEGVKWLQLWTKAEAFCLTTSHFSASLCSPLQY